MRKYKIACIMLICIAMLSTTFHVGMAAATITGESAVFNPDDLSLTIKGTITGISNSIPVNITVYRPGFTPEQLDVSKDVLNGISNTRLVPRDANGSFEWTYKLNQTAGATYSADLLGEYTVRFKIADLSYTIPVYVGNRVAVETAMMEINTGAPSIDEQKAIFERNKQVLYLNTTVYDKIQKVAAKDTVIANIFKKQYATPSALQTEFIKESVLQLLGNAATNNDIIYLVDNHNLLIKLDLESEWYLGKVKTEDQQQRIYTKIRTAGPYTDFMQAEIAYYEGLLVEAVNKADSPGEFYRIISDFNEKINDVVAKLKEKSINVTSPFKIDFTNYHQLMYKDPVLNAVIKRSDYKNSSDIKTTWDKAVNTQRDVENVPTRPPGRETGGGGYTPTTNPNSIKPVTGNPDDLGITKTVKNTGDIQFSDLASVPWATNSIISLAKAGIVNGKTATSFEPNANITREEFIKMLYLSANLSLKEDAKSTFKDVDENEWYYPYVASAQSMNLISGISNDSFGIGQNISRQDMAVMVVRLVSTIGEALPQTNEKVTFKDDGTIRDYANVSVYAMQRAGIINGYDDQTFAPEAFATRAEAAKIIFQLCELIMN